MPASAETNGFALEVVKSLLRKPKKHPPEKPTVADNHGRRSSRTPLPNDAETTEMEREKPLAVSYP
jgi:hypothetical protein